MSQALTPLFDNKIEKQFGLAYPTYDTVIPDIFHVQDITNRYIQRQGWQRYGLPGQRDPGTSIKLGDFRPSFGMKYIVNNYGLSDTLAIEDWNDDQHGVLSREIASMGGGFAEAFSVLDEVVAYLFFKNLAFAANATTGLASPDGYSLFNTAHPTSEALSYITWGNRPSTEVDASIAAYQGAYNNIATQVAANNQTKIKNKIAAIVAHTSQRYVWQQILKSETEFQTANRAENFIPKDGVRFIEWAYWEISGSTGTNNSWMALGQRHSLNFIRRQKPKFNSDWIPQVLAYLFTCYSRFTLGHDDPRGTYGSAGV